MHLLNAAICPCEGTYDVRKIDDKEFFELLEKAITDSDIEFKHFIGYQETLDFIHENLDINLGRTNREMVELKHMDEMLIIRIGYRDDNKKEFKNLTLEDFEFLQVFYLSSDNVI